MPLLFLELMGVSATNCIPRKRIKIAHSGMYSSLGKGGYVFGCVGWFVCGQQYSKSYEWIWMKFYGSVLGSTMKN